MSGTSDPWENQPTTSLPPKADSKGDSSPALDAPPKPEPKKAKPKKPAKARHPLLTGNVADARKNISACTDASTLKAMYDSEKVQDKPRSSVMNAITERIQRLGPQIGPITEAKPKTPTSKKKAPMPKSKPKTQETVTTSGPMEPYAVFKTKGGDKYVVEFETRQDMLLTVGTRVTQAAQNQQACVMETAYGHVVIVDLDSVEVHGSAGIKLPNIRRMSSYDEPR
jgi:hypothetical protein